MEFLVVSKQTPSNIKKAVHLAAKLKALLDEETAKKVGEKGVSVEDFRGDAVITIGGDGTFLWAASKTSKPILPVRSEGVGFLCSVDYDELIGNVNRLLNGDLVRNRLNTLKLMKEGDRVDGYAINEIVVTRKFKSKVMRAHITIDERFYYRGDGFVVSTSQGSTAYNLSLGGPVISDNSKVVFTPMAPMMRISSMVFPPPMEFVIERSDETAVLDGNRIVEIEKDVQYAIDFGRKITVLSLKPLNHFSKYIQSLK